MKTQNKTVADVNKLSDLPIVYIAGKISGLDYDVTFLKFKSAQLKLEARGYYVLNPMELVHKEANWEDAMRICLSFLPYAQYIYTLPDCKDSKGAIIEIDLAEKLGIVNLEEL
jgi:hypothetical protein